MNNKSQKEWLLLIHQIPPKPDYFRVKIWRKLQKIGAVAIKQSVYVLPDTGQAYEDLHWLVKEITAGGGTASLSRAEFLEGLSVVQVETLFCVARDEEYDKIVRDAQLFKESLTLASEDSDGQRANNRALNRLKSRFLDNRAIDFFDAPGRVRVEGILAECEVLLGLTPEPVPSASCKISDYSGKTWVTRKGIHEDRMACAWLIKRFIDTEAEFRFLDSDEQQAATGEYSFDMFTGDFTHQGDKCSFEVLLQSFGLVDSALITMAEIIHDLDLKDGKYGRSEAQGLSALFRGIAATEKDDQHRLQQGTLILDALYAAFSEAL